MSKGRRIITAGGEPTKVITPPVIVTAAGEPVVHEDAVTQTPVSVTDHAITGDVDPDATDNGALQAPGLPVEVTSGELGPGAAYNSPVATRYQNLQTDQVDLLANTHVVADSGGDLNLGTGQNNQLIVVCASMPSAGTNSVTITNVTGDITILYTFDESLLNNLSSGFFVAKLTGTGTWSLNFNSPDCNWNNSEGVRMAHSKY